MIVKLGSLISEYSVRNKADEDIPVYSVTNEQGFCTGYFSKEVASQDRTTYKIVPRGCFAYNPSRINVGSVDVQECEDRVIVSPLYVVFSVDEKLNRRYLLHYLKSDITLTYIKAYASGSVRDNLKFSILKDFPINLPSAEEQGQIVATLDGIEHLIALRKEEIASLDELVKSRFIEMFVTDKNVSHWPQVAISDVSTDMRTGPFGSALHHDEFVDSGVFVLGIDNAVENRFSYNRMRYITEEKYSQLKRYTVYPGDVIITIMGTVGRSAVIPQDMPKAINTKHLACITPDSAVIDPCFLASAFQMHPTIRLQLQNQCKGAIMDGLNLTIIKGLRFQLPPIDQQKQFSGFVEQTDKSKLCGEMEVAA